MPDLINTGRPALISPLTLTLARAAVGERIKYLEKSDSASDTRELLLNLYKQAAAELDDTRDNFSDQIAMTLETKVGS